MPQRFASAWGKPAGCYVDAFMNPAKEKSCYLVLKHTNIIKSQKTMLILHRNAFLLQFKTCHKNLATETGDVCHCTTYNHCPAGLQ